MGSIVLDSVSLGYPLIGNQLRQLSGIKLFVGVQNAAHIDATHLLSALDEAWSDQAPILILSVQSPQLLGDLLDHASPNSPGGAWDVAGGPMNDVLHGYRHKRVALMASAMGVFYTVFSEWNNTVITRTWACSSLMPTLWGIGLSPILQWLLIPALAFWRLSKQTARTRV